MLDFYTAWQYLESVTLGARVKTQFRNTDQLIEVLQYSKYFVRQYKEFLQMGSLSPKQT